MVKKCWKRSSSSRWNSIDGSSRTIFIIKTDRKNRPIKKNRVVLQSTATGRVSLEKDFRLKSDAIKFARSFVKKNCKKK